MSCHYPCPMCRMSLLEANPFWLLATSFNYQQWNVFVSTNRLARRLILRYCKAQCSLLTHIFTWQVYNSPLWPSFTFLELTESCRQNHSEIRFSGICTGLALLLH